MALLVSLLFHLSALRPPFHSKALFFIFFNQPKLIFALSMVGFEPGVIQSCQISGDSVISVAIRKERNGFAVRGK
jgi:hypothetical protein